MRLRLAWTNDKTLSQKKISFSIKLGSFRDQIPTIIGNRVFGKTEKWG